VAAYAIIIMKKTELFTINGIEHNFKIDKIDSFYANKRRFEYGRDELIPSDFDQKRWTVTMFILNEDGHHVDVIKLTNVYSIIRVEGDGWEFWPKSSLADEHVHYEAKEYDRLSNQFLEITHLSKCLYFEEENLEQVIVEDSSY
jgi:hypothetical protein